MSLFLKSLAEKKGSEPMSGCDHSLKVILHLLMQEKQEMRMNATDFIFKG